MSEGAQVLIRADAGVSIGNGHVMRCLSLALALAARGVHCAFASATIEGHLAGLVRDRGFTVHELPDGIDAPTDAQLTRGAAGDASWLVVDHYRLNADWELAVRAAGQRLMAIDDLADRAHHAELLLDQNLGRSESDYAGLVDASCELLIGPAYALLQPVFAAARATSLARRGGDRWQRLLVSLGGVDAGNATASVLRALAATGLPSEASIVVALGPHAPWAGEVRALAGHLPWRCEVRQGLGDLAALLVDADLAIGAAGGSAWERCALGVPTLLVLLADNQAPGAQALDAAGAARLLGPPAALAGTLPQALRSLAEPGVLPRMSRAAAAVTDGRGAERVADRIAARLAAVQGP
jgi:UDP-2,4-diacetamido-2,4,6-trideoxy-beta-L-altropyranose hydrolase